VICQKRKSRINNRAEKQRFSEEKGFLRAFGRALRGIEVTFGRYKKRRSG